MSSRPVRHFTHQDVAGCYSEEKAEDERINQWPVFYIYHPLSFRITPHILKLGVSANKVTLFSLILVLGLPLLAMLISDAPYIAVAVLGLLIMVLDCVDGDIARVTGSTSSLGAYLDFFTDIVYRLMFYCAIGILIERGDGVENALGGFAIEVAMIAFILAILARAARLYTELHAEQAVYGADQAKNTSSLDSLISFLMGLDYAFPLLLLLFGILGWLPGLLLGILCYSLLDLMLTQKLVIERFIKESQC